jgi:hypothetical protein
MSNGNSRDHLLFNCSQKHEIDYVAGLYTEHKKVEDFLVEQCKNGVIKNFTHAEVYVLIKLKLGLARR